MDPKNGEVYPNNEENITDYADLLIADVPAGSGWSEQGTPETKVDEDLENNVKFFELLAESPLLNSKDIFLKKREIILWGISWGTNLMAGIGSLLIPKKFRIKGALLDSLWVSNEMSMKYFPDLVTENTPFDTPAENMEAAENVQSCYDDMKNGIELSSERKVKCASWTCGPVGMNMDLAGREKLKKGGEAWTTVLSNGKLDKLLDTKKPLKSMMSDTVVTNM